MTGALWVADALFAFANAGARAFHLHWGKGGDPQGDSQPNTGVQTNFILQVRLDLASGQHHEQHQHHNMTLIAACITCSTAFACVATQRSVAKQGGLPRLALNLVQNSNPCFLCCLLNDLKAHPGLTVHPEVSCCDLVELFHVCVVQEGKEPWAYPSVHGPWYGYLFWVMATAGAYGQNADSSFVSANVEKWDNCTANIKVVDRAGHDCLAT